MSFKDLSIRWKLLTGFVGLALFVLIVVLFSVSQFLDDRIRKDINSNFENAGNIFEQLQDVRFRQLRQTAILVGEIPYMKAAISTEDPVTISDQIRNALAPLLEFDPLLVDTTVTESITSVIDSLGLFMVLDLNGMPMGQLSEGELPKDSYIERAGVREALLGQMPDQAYIWGQGGQYYKVITIPVFIQDQLIAALSFGYPIRNSEADLLAQLIEYEVIYIVNGEILTHSMDLGSPDEMAEIEATFQNMLSGNSSIQTGIMQEMDFAGENWLIYVLPMGEDGLANNDIDGYFTFAQSLSTALAPVYELQRVLLLIGLGGIALAVITGVTLTQTMTRPINSLMDGIQRIENQDYDNPVEVENRDELGRLTETFNTLTANIKENLREKAALLIEIHHRVKNNLAVISGLLELESDTADNEQIKRILKNSQLRIHSMATVHEMLYQAQNFSKLSFDVFVLKIVESVKEVYSDNRADITLDLDINPVRLNVNQAVPFGLIINELVTNAIKHAYPANSHGIVHVSLYEEDGNIFLRISDNGVGLSKNFDLKKSESLGFTLVEILVRQIGATISIDSVDGTHVSITFGKQDKKGASSGLS